MSRFGTVLAILGLLVAPQMVSASPVFFSPDAAAATSDASTPPNGPDRLIDTSGLSSTPVTLANIGTISHESAGASSLWRGDSSDIPITLTFDFVSATDLKYVGLWQGFRLREGVKDFDLRFYDGASGTGSQIGGIFSGVLDDGSVTPYDMLGKAFDVGLRSGVRSFTMDIVTVANDLNGFVHLGEVMVAVPEPSTYAGLIGLTLGGLFIRRRQQQKAKQS